MGVMQANVLKTGSYKGKRASSFITYMTTDFNNWSIYLVGCSSDAARDGYGVGSTS